MLRQLATNIIIFITMTITFDVIKVIISVKLHSIPVWSILLCNLPPALITVTVKYINKRTKSLQQLNWNKFSLKRARELDQIAVKSNCHLFLTFIHNPFIKCKAMDDFVKLWSHVVALFVESCFYLLPFLLSVVCRWDWFHLFAVHHLPWETIFTLVVFRSWHYFCVFLYFRLFISRHDWFHQQVVQPQIDRLETIQLLEYQS